jgi:hypothetical protein
VILDIQFRWDCRTEPKYHETLQFRVKTKEPVEELTGDGYRTREREVWSHWDDVPYHTENIRE